MSTHALRLILFVLIFCLGDSVFAQTVNKTTVLSYENGKSNSGARARGHNRQKRRRSISMQNKA